MSCRRYSQPAPKTRQTAAQAATRSREVLVIRHLGNMMRMQALEEAGGVRQMKLRVAGLNANKEAVRRCMREAMHVGNRRGRLGQPTQADESENRAEPCAAYADAKGHRIES